MSASWAIAQDGASTPRYEPKMIINYGGGGWKNAQVQEPCVLVNPKDASKLVMFFSGTALDNGHGQTATGIAKAWANISDPLTWHEDVGNPFFNGDPTNPSIRSIRPRFRHL